MKKHFITLLILIFLSIKPRSVIAGGGWVHDQSNGYFKVAYSILSSDRIYGYDGEQLTINETGVQIGSFYGEYGIGKSFNAILYLPFYYKSTFGDVTLQPSGAFFKNDQTTNIGDVQIGIKYGIIKKGPIILSTTLTFGIPLGVTNGGKSGLLQTGDGEFNQAIRVDISHSFHPIPIWISLGTEFNNRTNGFSDEYNIYFEGGTKIKEKWIVVGKLNSKKSLKNGFENELVASNFSNDIEYLNVSGEIGFNVYKKLWVSTSLTYPLSGRKNLVALTYSLGVFIDLK